MFLYFLDVNSKHAPTQVEVVLTIASEALIGNPTIVTDVPIVETPLTKATEVAPELALVVIYCGHSYISVAFQYIVL